MRGSWRLRTWRGKLYESVEALRSRRLKPEDCIVVNGFWRSGTTWLQQVIAASLSARCVYEPLEARNARVSDWARNLSLPRTDAAFVNGLFPFAGSDLQQDPELAGLLRRALAGGWYGIWSPLRPEYADRVMSDVFRHTIVTKFVRANLCLGALQNEFDVPAIHVWRDPRAIVTSLSYPDPSWGGGTFQDFSVKAYLLDIDDGREDVFSRWRDEIVEIDAMPNVARLAAYLCLTEAYLMESSTAGRRLVIDYATLVRDGFDEVYEFLESRGFQPAPGSADPSKPSASDKGSVHKGAPLSADERLHRWRDILPAGDAELVKSIAEQFGLGSRCEG